MNKGFSLVELIVVIAIMAILVGVAVPVYTSYITDAKNKVDAQLVGEIDHAIEVLLIDNEVTNPVEATKGTPVVITLSATGSYTMTGATDNTTFVTKLAEVVPASALKGTDYQYGATFTIDGYQCIVAKAAAPAPNTSNPDNNNNN